MLRGLEPETKYTVSGSFSLNPSYKLGAVVFRTDYARLDGIETSGLTHTEATVKVSLVHADVDKRCCIPLLGEPRRNRARAHLLSPAQA